jgi:GGDEF domain-containing protein
MQFASEKILLVGDREGHVHDAIASAMTDAQIVRATNVFDGIAELHGAPFSAVVASVEPIERRPEPAVIAMRRLVGERGRVLLFGHSTLEPLSRKMLGFGCDDYFVTPADPGELRQLFSTTRKTPDAELGNTDASAIDATGVAELIDAAALLDLALDALAAQPQASTTHLIEQLAARIPRGLTLTMLPQPKLEVPSISEPVRNAAGVVGHLHLLGDPHIDQPPTREAMAKLAKVVSKVAMLEERHGLMQRLAITDDLTGLYNGRYFNHFLSRILEKAKAKRFAVTLLLFDIDNFKRYNDQFGHGVGDEILRQTASLMKRCCRDHDLVARIAGDEFAVVFWEKEGPRVPRDPNLAGHSRVPSTPMIIAERFRKLLGSSEFSALGPAGKGVLTISGGMAVYPFDGQTPSELIEAADRALMFGAKKAGKNSIAIVGDEEGQMFAGE